MIPPVNRAEEGLKECLLLLKAAFPGKECHVGGGHDMVTNSFLISMRIDELTVGVRIEDKEIVMAGNQDAVVALCKTRINDGIRRLAEWINLEKDRG